MLRGKIKRDLLTSQKLFAEILLIQANLALGNANKIALLIPRTLEAEIGGGGVAYVLRSQIYSCASLATIAPEGKLDRYGIISPTVISHYVFGKIFCLVSRLCG